MKAQDEGKINGKKDHFLIFAIFMADCENPFLLLEN